MARNSNTAGSAAGLRRRGRRRRSTTSGASGTAAAGRPLRVVSRAWYNPNLETRWNLMPGMIAALSMLQTLLLTALSVAREREQGTFDQLLVTPLRPPEIMIGKALPPVLIGLMQSTLVLLVTPLWFQVPMAGSLLTLYAGLRVLHLASVGIGLSISAVSASMQQAMLYTFVLIMPMMLLSGLTTPVSNMPALLQIATLANPLRFAIDLVQRVYLEGVGPAHGLAQPHPAAGHRGRHAAAGGMALPQPSRLKGHAMRTLHLPLVAALLLAGCAVGPDFKAPAPEAPADFSAWHGGSPTLVDPQQRRGPYVVGWALFADPVLDDLQARALAANHDLQTATLRFAQSRAQRSVAEAAAMPAAQRESRRRAPAPERVGRRHAIARRAEPAEPRRADRGAERAAQPLPGGLRRRLGARPVGPRAARRRGGRRQRRRVAGAAGAGAAQRAERTGPQLLRAAHDATPAAHHACRHRGRRGDAGPGQGACRRWPHHRPRRGAPGRADGRSARTAAAAAARRRRWRSTRSRCWSASAPARCRRSWPARDEAVASTLPDLSPGLPSEVALRRPDIQRAQAQLHAATAGIGVAVADLYPRITIGARFGFESVASGSFGDWGSRQWSIGPNLQLPIFDGGRLRSTVTLRELQQQEAAVAYQQTVLKAWHEIDDALSAYTADRQRHVQLTERERFSRDAWELARVRYDNGLTDFLVQLDAQRTLLAAQREHVQSAGRLALDLVALTKALGGPG